MAIMDIRRKPVKQQIWIFVNIATVVGCIGLLYGSLRYGRHHSSKTWKRREFSAVQGRFTDGRCISVCDSEECVQEAKLLWSQINISVHPCENFFQFACGKYLEKFDENESNTLQTRMKEQMLLKVKNVLENIKSDKNTASGKLKTVYDSCIKRSSSDMKATFDVTHTLYQFGIPKWPNLDSNFKFYAPSIQKVLSNFIAHKEYGFLNIATIPSFSDTNLILIGVKKGPYESKKYIEPDFERKILVEKILQYFNVNDENIVRIWNESQEILTTVINLKLESERIGNENDPFQMTAANCTLEHENEWKPVCDLLKSFFEIVGVDSATEFTIESSNVYFVQNIFSVLNDFNDRSIANFLSLNLLLSRLDDLNFYFRWLFHLHPTVTELEERQIGHWQHCTQWVMEKLFLPLGYEYMKSELSKSTLDELDDLMKTIITEIADEFSQQNWISDRLRKDLPMMIEFLEFSTNMLKDVLTNDTLLNDLFNQFHPQDGSFIFNVFEYQRYSKSEEMQGLRKAMFLEWIDSSLLTPMAVFGGGKIDLQLGILMPPIYHPNLERIINSVTLSTIVAHEIGHMSENFYRKFQQKKDVRAINVTDVARNCISNQYSKFKFKYTGQNVNGSKYVRENFADLIAISIIDNLIEKYSTESEGFFLPGFPYLTQQMLYLSSVQMFCAASNKKDEEFNYRVSTHSLPKFRLLGMMQNSRGFAKAFNCSEGSYMNPTTKCSYFVHKNIK